MSSFTSRSGRNDWNAGMTKLVTLASVPLTCSNVEITKGCPGCDYCSYEVAWKTIQCQTLKIKEQGLMLDRMNTVIGMKDLEIRSLKAILDDFYKREDARVHPDQEGK